MSKIKTAREKQVFKRPAVQKEGQLRKCQHLTINICDGDTAARWITSHTYPTPVLFYFPIFNLTECSPEAELLQTTFIQPHDIPPKELQGCKSPGDLILFYNDHAYKLLFHNKLSLLNALP